MVFGNKDNKSSHAKLAHEQVSYKMTEELKNIDRKEAEARHRRDSAQIKIQQITNQALARASRLTELRIRFASARDAYEASNKDAVAYAGTAGERAAMTTLKEQRDIFEQVQNDLARAEEHNKEAEASESAQLASLRAEAQSLADELAELDRQRADAQGTYERSLQNLGEAEYSDAVNQIETQARKVADARQAVVASQLALDQMVEDCITRLDDWPELARKIRSQYVTYHDEKTAILEAFILFVAAIKAGTAATIAPDILRAAGSPWTDTAQLLEVPIQQLGQALAGRSADIARLVEKQELAEKVLNTYRATKQEEVK